MAPPTDGVAQRTEDPQEQTDHEHYDADRPNEWSGRQEADQEKQESEGNHDITLRCESPSIPIRLIGSCVRCSALRRLNTAPPSIEVVPGTIPDKPISRLLAQRRPEGRLRHQQGLGLSLLPLYATSATSCLFRGGCLGISTRCTSRVATL
jgi:hypothetical protein